MGAQQAEREAESVTEPIQIPPGLPHEIAERLRKKDGVRWQHFVPVFYLRYFSGPKGLTVFNTKNRKILNRPHSPRGCACAEFYYGNWEGKNDVIAQVSEIMFEDFETRFAQVVPEIMGRMRGTGPLDMSDKHTLCDFMSFLWLRGP